MKEEEEELYNLIKEKYLSFNEKIRNEIQNNEFSYNKINCFLIDSSWENELANSILNEEKYNILLSERKLDDSFNFLPKQEPKFINEASVARNHLKNNNNIRLISRDIIKLVYPDYNLSNNNSINCYGGNNRLIIEFEENESNINNILLIINPIESILQNNNALIISLKVPNNNKEEFYGELLFMNLNLNLNEDINKNLKGGNIIIDNSQIFNKNNFTLGKNGLIRYNSQNSIKNILSTFIYIFYFEKSLSLLEENVFNQNQNYYIINIEWLDKFKEYYDYDKIYNILKTQYDIRNIEINYNNFEGHIFTIQNLYFKNIHLKISGQFEKYVNINEIYPKKKTKQNIEFYQNNFLIHEKIIEMIYKYNYPNEKILIKPKKIIVKNDNIYLFDECSINIGNLNEQYLFSPQYIFFYNQLRIMTEEKEKLFCLSIKDYIESRKCIENNYNIQTLIEENNKTIGKLIIFQTNSKKEKRKNEFKEYNIDKILKEKIDILESENTQKDTKYVKELNERDEIINKLVYENEEINKELNKLRNEKNEEENKEKNDIIKRLENEIKEKNNEIKTLENEIRNKNEMFGNSEIENQEKNEMIKNLENENKIKFDLIKKLQNENEENNDIIKNLQNEKEEKNDIIERLQNEMKEKDDTIEQLENEMKEKDDTIEQLENEIKENKKSEKQEKNDYIKNIGNEVKEKNNIIKNLEKEIKEKNKIIEKLENDNKKYSLCKQMNEKQKIRIKELEDLIEEISKKYNDLKFERNEKDKKEKKEHIETIKNLENEIEDINKKYNDLYFEKNEKNNENAKLRELNECIQKELKNKENQLENAQELNNKYKLDETKLIYTNKKMKEVEEQKKNLEKDLKLNKDKIIKLKYGSKNNKHKIIKNYETIIDEKERQIEELSKKNKKGNLEEKIKEMNELKEIIENKQNEINELNNKNIEIENQLKNKMILIDELMKENENLKNIEKKYEDDIKSIEKEKEKYESENKRIIEENNDLINRNKILPNINDNYEIKSKEELVKFEDNQNNDALNKEKELENLMKLNEELQKDNNDKNNEVEILKNNTDKIKQEFEDTIKQKDIKIDEIESQYKSIKEELSNKESIIININKENENLKNKLEEIQNEINELKNKKNIKEEMMEKNLEVNDELEELKKNNELLTQKEIDYKNIIENYKKSEELTKTENEDIKKELENKEKTIEEYLNKINELEKENKTKEDEIKNYENIIKESNELKDNLKNENESLKINEKELKIKEEELNKKEKEYNDKIALLKEKENLINKKYEENKNNELQLQKDIDENKEIKQQIKDLNITKTELEKEIKDKQNQYNQILSNLSHVMNNNYYNNENFSVSTNSSSSNFMLNFNSSNNNILNNKTIIEDIKNIINKEYEKPTLIGLNNIGATCFMNSTLQCLSQTKQLSNYFLNKENEDKIINNNISKKNKNDFQLSVVFLELIKNLWDKNEKKSFSPYNFMNTIEKMNPFFKQGTAGDAKDFVIYILEQIHRELKTSINKLKDEFVEPLNQYDKNNTFRNFLKDFQKEVSIISDVFFGFTETTNECLNCKNIYNYKGLNNPICYNYGIFNCIIFPLEEVKNFKINSLQSYNNYNNYNCGFNNNYNYNFNQISQSNQVTLYDCFLYNQKSDLFCGDNKNYCNMCKQLFDSNYTSRIYVSPNVLILILNRGKNNMYDVKVEITETIDITQFVLEKDLPQITYDLYGVITHIGQSGPNAHFIASCKSPVDNKWYKYNDAFVNSITDFQKEVIQCGTPYILFYQKNKFSK